MLWKIVRKEILSNVITFRFSVGTALFMVLIVLFTQVMISDYNQNLKNYDELVMNNETELMQLMTYQNLRPTIYKPPEVLAVFSKGVIENMGNSSRISISEVPAPKSAATEKNALLSIFPLLDIALVFKVVISLFTLLLAYDAISGEKEDRTLALILSNSVPRSRILFGKFLSALITIAIPVALGFIVQGLMFTLSTTIHLTASDWLRIFLIFITSLLFIGVMLSLGLFISSMTKRASDTLIFLLFFWVVFVFVVPNLSAYFAGQFKSVESREKIDSQVDGLWSDFRSYIEEKNQEFYKDVMAKMMKNPENKDIMANYTQSDEQEPWGYYHIFGGINILKNKQQLNSESEPLKIETADKVWQVEKNYLGDMKLQKKLADFLSRISPVSVYENLISGLSRSDVASYEKFYDQAREYRNQTINYLFDKQAFSSLRYIATVKEEHLFELKNMEEYSTMRAKYAEADATPLNMADYPRFRYQSERIPDTLIRTLPDLALLIIIGLILFLCAFVSFLKYDVR